MGRGVKTAVIGGVFAVMVGGAAYGAYNVVSALDEGGGSGAAGAATKSGPPSADEVEETTGKFFAAWEKGDATTAASYTNNASVAGTLLTAYGRAAHITGVEITPGEPTVSGMTVPFTVKAKVSYDGTSKPLTYRSQLTVVRGQTSGRALVDWDPAVVHPRLKTGDTLVTEESATPQIQAVDRDDTVLTPQKYPSLAPVLATLREKYGDKAGGTPGVELAIRHEATQAPDTPLLTLTEGRPGKLRTTLSAGVQAAAEKAVRRYGESSVVAVRPSTGE
ncbi:NTF2-like N-terminal transpeptidase domain-containing protein, partial [Streptomyces sp. NPDC059701]